MRLYRHTQIGTLNLVVLGTGVLLLLGLAAWRGFNLILFMVLLLLVAGAVLFCSLTVKVTAQVLEIRFGPGLIRKSFLVHDIREAQIVRNPWYYGWGIRLIPHGWLFNVSGVHAVEIKMANAKMYRIGTDRPNELLGAIRQAAQLAA